jgi:Hypervirulence associated proteins TUDOR domain
VNRRLRKGDRVAWNTPQGKTTGTVEQELTESGKRAAHRPEALDKR